MKENSTGKEGKVRRQFNNRMQEKQNNFRAKYGNEGIQTKKLNGYPPLQFVA